jgi:protein TonB
MVFIKKNVSSVSIADDIGYIYCMKKILFIVAITSLTLKSNAQIYIALEDTRSVYPKVDVDPEFPGRFVMFHGYIDDSSTAISKSNHALGVVVAGFIIEKNGKITQPVILKGLTPETDSAAVYLLKNSHLWKPGTKNGVPVRTYMRIAVKFNSAGYQVVHTTDVKTTSPSRAEVVIDEPIGTSTPKYDNDNNQIFTTVERAPSYIGGYDTFNA